MKKTARYSITFLFLLAAVAAAATFSPGTEVARFPAELDEISGMAASRVNTGVLWVHNDSGDGPQIYAVNSKAKLLGTYLLEGTKAVDWEDMSIGPAPMGSYLYVADIGDNNSNRSSVHIYRVAEPQVDANQSPAKVSLKNVSDFEFVYEDGPRDAEAFMVDPLNNDFYVVTKRELTGNRLYRAVSPQSGAMNTLHRAGTFSFFGTTGASISPDGMQVLIRRYSNANDSALPASKAGSYWARKDASISLPDLLKEPDTIVPLVREVQGEAIAFAADGKGFYTTSERGADPNAPLAPLTFYELMP